MPGIIDHKAARGQSPVGAAQSTRDTYARTQLVLFRDRSRSPKRNWNELDFGERQSPRGRATAARWSQQQCDTLLSGNA